MPFIEINRLESLSRLLHRSIRITVLLGNEVAFVRRTVNWISQQRFSETGSKVPICDGQVLLANKLFEMVKNNFLPLKSRHSLRQRQEVRD